MATTAVPLGISLRCWERQDGTITESYTVRWKEPDGRKRRRSFDTVEDALDFQAKRRSAKRWRPEELRQEQAGSSRSASSSSSGGVTTRWSS